MKVMRKRVIQMIKERQRLHRAIRLACVASMGIVVWSGNLAMASSADMQRTTAAKAVAPFSAPLIRETSVNTVKTPTHQSIATTPVKANDAAMPTEKSRTVDSATNNTMTAASEVSAMDRIPRMIYTTEPAVAYVFAGLSKPEIVRDTLQYLKQEHSKGTFFVTEREIRREPQLVQEIIDSGNEVAIGIQSLKNSSYKTTVKQIRFVRSYLASHGVDTNLAMQPMGIITEDTYRAVADEGCTIYRPTLTMVSSKHKEYTSADAVMKEQFGRFSYAVGRGWIVYFRLDYYDKASLVLDVMDLVKRHKIDPVAYYSVYDDPATNPNNDSAYRITSMGDILEHKDKLYNLQPHKTYSKDGADYKVEGTMPFTQFLAHRYIGNPAVQEDNLYGFTEEEKRYRDNNGRIHAKEPVVFFTFDDFGSDISINHLLYVFRKHKAKGTFFVLTKNILNNPNVVRAIAEEGHDVASHSEEHRAMQAGNYKENYGRYLVDYGLAAEKLYDVVGDIRRADGSSAYTHYFRPPTLSLSRAGAQALLDTGYEYVVAGSSSTHDYKQPELGQMIKDIKAGIFDKQGHVIDGAVLVMHMSDQAMYTAMALDMLMTENDKRPDGDPAKFTAIPLSVYLGHGQYRQDDTASGQYGDSIVRKTTSSAKVVDAAEHRSAHTTKINGGVNS